MTPTDDDNWLYHLPKFLERVRETGTHGITEEVDLPLGGVLYHHRGARVPADDATFVWHGADDRFELILDAVGPRQVTVDFDANRSWDFYVTRIEGDQPCLAWMTDAEFREEEAAAFDGKHEAIGSGRFSFGLYLHAPRTWQSLVARARDTDAPVFVHRPDGRTFVPEPDDLAAVAEMLPEELRPNDQDPPAYFGVHTAYVESK